MYFRENWLIFLRIWGEAELILRIWGAKENTFRELRNFLLGIWGDQCIIFRDQGSTDPPPGASSFLHDIIFQTQFAILYICNCSFTLPCGHAL